MRKVLSFGMVCVGVEEVPSNPCRAKWRHLGGEKPTTAASKDTTMWHPGIAGHFSGNLLYCVFTPGYYVKPA